MTASEILEQIRRLPRAQQYEVAEKVWAEFGDFDEELTPEQMAELERRAEDARKHPERCRPIEEVFTDIEKRCRAKHPGSTSPL
jgi:putative addiction module component (TIGR02574 family)